MSAATEPDPQPGFPHSLGILFVHGIGQQARGETVVRCGEPLLGWFRRWIGGREAGPILSFDQVAEQRRAAAAAGPRGPAVEVVDAALKARPDEPGAPAAAELRVRLPDAAGELRDRSWLLAEAFWSETFLPPRFGEMARWGLIILPWTVASHLGTRIRRARKRIRARRGPGARPLAALELLRVLLLLIALPLAAAGVMVLILLLLLLALLPIPRLRAALLGVQRRLAATLGDSYVLLQSRLQREAIAGQVHRDLAWLAERCRRIALIAHSQGAAVTHEALGRGLPARLRPDEVLLLTFGSGLNKLEELRWLERTQPWWIGWAAPGALVLAAVAGLLSGVPFAGLRTEPWVVGWIAMIGLGLLLSGAGATIRGAKLGAADFDPERRFGLALSWLDRFSAEDPVPNGPLFDDDQTPSYLVGRSREDHNGGSSLTDHNAYWRNPDGFVAAVARAVCALDGLRIERVRTASAGAAAAERAPDEAAADAEAETGAEARADAGAEARAEAGSEADAEAAAEAARLDLGWHRRRFRAEMLRPARTAATLFAIALPVSFGLRGRLEAIGATFLPWAERTAELLPGFLERVLSGWIGALLPATLGALAVAAAVGAVYLALYWSWRWWAWGDVTAFFWREDYRLPWPFWQFVALSAGGLAVGALLVAGWPGATGADEALVHGPALSSFVVLMLWHFGRRLATAGWRALAPGAPLRWPLRALGKLLEAYLRAFVAALAPSFWVWTVTAPAVAALVPLLGPLAEHDKILLVLRLTVAGLFAVLLLREPILVRLRRRAAVGPPVEALGAVRSGG